VNPDLIPTRVEEIPDPKNFLIELVRGSRKKDLKRAIVPLPKTTPKQGPDYNAALIKFVYNHWEVEEAAKNSPSLRRTIDAIDNFKPEIDDEKQ